MTVYRSDELRPLLLEENSVPAGNSTVLAREHYWRAWAASIPAWRRVTIGTSGHVSPFSPPSFTSTTPSPPTASGGGPIVGRRARFPADAATIRSRNFPDAGPISRSYLARWQREAARRDVALGRRLPAASHFVRAAWFARSPGQLVYAAASAIIPGPTENRLRRIERERGLPQGWEADVAPWLARYRQEPTSPAPSV